jgi:hypothetical protein
LATDTVQLTLVRKIPHRTLQLTISSVLIRDAQGRELDGNGDGQSGGDFTATLNRSGVISMARRATEAQRVTRTAVIDALLTDGSLAGLIRSKPRPARSGAGGQRAEIGAGS